AEPSANTAVAGAERSRMAMGVFGNIDFAPMSELVVSVASGIEKASGDMSDQQAMNTPPARTTRSAALTSPGDERDPRSWVQLAALSDMDTAERVWSSLKERHTALLSDRKPRYFGPDEVGGSFYHIRIGPMATDAAMTLCDALEAEGADCFCIYPKAKGMS
ncbi:MAG: SPOR domain-containing protein, partial [Geminicoccaceae bacterium]